MYEHRTVRVYCTGIPSGISVGNITHNVANTTKMISQDGFCSQGSKSVRLFVHVQYMCVRARARVCACVCISICARLDYCSGRGRLEHALVHLFLVGGTRCCSDVGTQSAPVHSFTFVGRSDISCTFHVLRGNVPKTRGREKTTRNACS